MGTQKAAELVRICSRELVVLAGVRDCLAWFCDRGLATMELLRTGHFPAGKRDQVSGQTLWKRLARWVVGRELGRPFWYRRLKGSNFKLISIC